MTFATPLLLLALAILVPVLIAFLVRIRRDVVKVPSVLLFRLAGARVVRQRRFKNLRRWLAALLCLAGVAALVLAAAKPSAKSRGETVAIVIDISASMAAGGRTSPLARAKAFAARRIASGGPRDRYAIVAAGSAPRRLAGPSAPGPELDQALELLEAEKGSADLDPALELGAALVSGASDPKVVVLGDGGAAVVAPARLSTPIAVRTFPVEARDDLGIFSMTSRPIVDSETERDVAISVATSSARPRRARLELEVEGKRLLDRVLDVPARGEAELHARVVVGASSIVAKVSAADGIADALALDDRAEIVEKDAAKKVLLVASPTMEPETTFFVEKAIGAAGGFEMVRTAPGEAPPPDVGVAVALGAQPDSKLTIPALYLGTSGGALPFSGFRELEGETAHLRSTEAKDPLLRGVALDGVTIEHATAITVPKGARALVDLDGGSVLVVGGTGRGRWIYLGIDASRSDLALRVAFPVLVANALHALGGVNDVIAAETVARGEIALADAAPADLPDEPAPRWRFPIAPAALLALVGALLLGLEAYTWRKGWANG